MSVSSARLEVRFRWNTFIANYCPASLNWLFRTLRSTYLIKTVGRRLDFLRLLPFHDEANQWKSVDNNSNWSTSLYLRSEPRRLLQYVMNLITTDESVLDLGCNNGSDLDILRRAGWSQLAGIDVGDEALKLFAEQYPDTFAKAKIYQGRFEDVLPSLEANSFDNIFSNGATLELVHPAWCIEAQMARVVRKRILLDVNEKGHSYPRDYVKIFRKLGMDLIEEDRPLDRIQGHSLLVFQHSL